MAIYLKTAFIQKFNIKITLNLIKQIDQMLMLWETRRTHPLALNSSLFGIENIFFTTGDQQHLFDICNVSKEEFKQVIQQVSLIRNSAMDITRIVTSDPYNVFTTWLVYLVGKSTLNNKLKFKTQVQLIKMLNYKFFTSLVNHNFPNHANENIMVATIDGLSAKFDIKNDKTPTWKLVIEARSKDLIDKNSIHYKTISAYGPDEKVLYMLSDTQTRIRTKIKLITRQYYINKEHDNKVSNYGIVDEIDGKKIIKPIVSSYDNMISGIVNSSLNTSTFINNDYIKLITALNKNIRPELFRTFLTWFSDRSVGQFKNHTLEETIGSINEDGNVDDTNLVYIGHKILIQNIIQKSYRTCFLDKVDLTSKLAILEAVRNTYRSSREIDPDIQIIKNSVERIIEEEFKLVQRESTKVSLKISFILYIIILSFEYI